MELQYEVDSKELSDLIEEYRSKLSNLRIVVEDIDQMMGLTSDQAALLKDLLDLTSTRDVPQSMLNQLVRQRPRVIEETSTVLELVIEKSNRERPVQINPLNIWLSSNMSRGEKKQGEKVDINSLYRSRLGDLVLQDLEYYIPLDAVQHELEGSNFDTEDEKNSFDLFEKGITPFLFGKSKVLLLLGNAGSGKTTFVHWLMLHAEVETKRTPIYVDLKEYDTLQSCLKNEYVLDKDSVEELKKRPLFFLLDGYDEKTIDNYNIFKQHGLREWPEAKCLVTCRTRFLPSSFSQLFNYEGFSPFQTLYVAPFSPAKIARYIDRTSLVDDWTPQKYHDALDENPDLKALVNNPLILKMVIKALPRIMLNKNMATEIKKHPRIDYLPVFTASDVYRAFMSDWFVREKEKIGKETLQLWGEEYYTEEAFGLFCETLAFAMFLEDKLSIQYQPIGRYKGEAVEKWHKFFNAKEVNVAQVLRGSPLSCVNYHYKFYHKSFMEYFAALHVFNETCKNPEFDVNKLEEGVINQKLFPKETGMLNYLSQMVRLQIKNCDLLLDIGYQSRSSAKGVMVKIASENAISVLNRAAFNFNGLDLSHLNIPSADLRHAYLDGTNLQGTDLSTSLLSQSWLRGSDLRGADLSCAEFGQNPFLEHKHTVNSIRFCAKTNLLVTSDKHRIYIWDLETDQIIQRLNVHKYGAISIQSLDISEDGEWIVLGCEDVIVRTLPTTNIDSMNTFVGHEDTVQSVAISATGQWIVSGSEDKTLRVWSNETEQAVQVLIGHEDSVFCVALSKDCKWIASGSNDKTVRLWLRETGEALRILHGHENVLRSVDISTDGQWVVSGSLDGTVRVWSHDSDQEIYQLKGHESVFSVAFSADQKWIVSCGDHTVRLWSHQTGKAIVVLQEKGFPRCAAISPDGRRIYSGIYNSPIGQFGELIRAFSGAPEKKEQTRRRKENYVRIWSMESVSKLQSVRSNNNHVNCVELSENGEWVVLGNEDATVKLCSKETGMVECVMHGHEGAVVCVAINANSNMIASGSVDKTIRIWSIEQGATVKVLRGHEDSITSVNFSSDNQWIVSGSNDKSIRLWCLETGLETRKFLGHKRGSITAIFCSDGKCVVSCAPWDVVQLWSVDSGETLQILDDSFSHITQIASDEKNILYGVSSVISLWSIELCKIILEIPSYEIDGNITCVSLSRDGKWIVTANCDENAVILWDRLNSTLIARIELEFFPLSAKLSPDSSQLLIGTQYGFQIWHSGTDKHSWALLYSTFDSPTLFLSDCNVEGAHLSRQNYTLLEQHGALVDYEFNGKIAIKQGAFITPQGKGDKKSKQVLSQFFPKMVTSKSDAKQEIDEEQKRIQDYYKTQSNQKISAGEDEFIERDSFEDFSSTQTNSSEEGASDIEENSNSNDMGIV